jgi:preprotein translocase subunit SecB
LATVATEPTADRDAAWLIEADFVASFVTLSDREFAPEQLRAFAYVTGAMAVHPFAREFVQSATVRLGYPAFTLPFIRRPLDPRSGADSGGSAPTRETLTW